MWISYFSQPSFRLFHTLTFGYNCSTSLIRRRFMDRWCINTLFCRHTQRTSGPQSVLFLKIYTATAANHWWEPSASCTVMCACSVQVGLNRLFWFCLWLATPKSQANSCLRFVFKRLSHFGFYSRAHLKTSCSRWDSTGYDAFDDASAATETKPPPPLFFLDAWHQCTNDRMVLLTVYTILLCVSVCVCVHLQACVSLGRLRSSAVNTKWHSTRIFRPDMSPTWQNRISDLTCWHAVSRREAMEQSKPTSSGERETERGGGYAAAVDSAVCLHPPRVQTRTDSYTRCLEISHSFSGGSKTGEKGVNFNMTFFFFFCAIFMVWSTRKRNVLLIFSSCIMFKRSTRNK